MGPAPNEYYPLTSIIFQNRLVTGEASFKSGSRRVLPIVSNSLDPGPGYYSPKYHLTYTSSPEQRSCFVSGNKREINLELSTKEGPGKLIEIKALDYSLNCQHVHVLRKRFCSVRAITISILVVGAKK